MAEKDSAQTCERAGGNANFGWLEIYILVSVAFMVGFFVGIGLFPVFVGMPK